MVNLRRLRIPFAAIVAALALFFLIGVAMNRTAMSVVRVKLKAGADEPSDHHLLGVGGKDKLPDYELRFRSGDDWRPIAAHRNTTAKDGLEFRLNEPWPMRKVDELQLVELDHLEDDVLEQIQIQPGRIDGNAFEFEVVKTESWSAGAEWFWDSSIGKAILLGITLGVAAIVIGNFGI